MNDSALIDGRVGNSLTAVATATPIGVSTALTMLLPATVGTYYISKVGLMANG